MNVFTQKQVEQTDVSNLLTYKGYYTLIHFEAEDKVLYGKIENANGDLVTFESDSAKEIEKEFHDAVDDWLEFRKEIDNEVESKEQVSEGSIMDCFNYNCPFRSNTTSSSNRCECTACPNRREEAYTAYPSNYTLTDNELILLKTNKYLNKEEQN